MPTSAEPALDGRFRCGVTTPRGLGVLVLRSGGGQAAGAPLVGLLADRTGIAVTFYACAGVALAGSLLTLPRRRLPGR